MKVLIATSASADPKLKELKAKLSDLNKEAGLLAKEEQRIQKQRQALATKIEKAQRALDLHIVKTDGVKLPKVRGTYMLQSYGVRPGKDTSSGKKVWSLGFKVKVLSTDNGIILCDALSGARRQLKIKVADLGKKYRFAKAVSLRTQ